VKDAFGAPEAAPPKSPYSPAVRSEGWVLVSGTGALDPKTGEYQKGDVGEETQRALRNIEGLLAARGLTLESVVKVNVYLRDIKDFAAMNEVYARVFKPPYPARTTIQAGRLPRNFAVEIECLACP
jgi:2-iminobutanoate/2-iminopropanoate deaminase